VYLLHFERSECDSDGLVYRVGLAERQVPHEEPVTRVVAAGHDVTAVARNPGKLTRQVRTVIAGLAAEPATQAAAAGPVHIPGQAARAIRDGGNLAPDRAVGKRTWEEFLSDRI
jgi:hypothetical protein